MKSERTSANDRTLPTLAIVVPCYDEEDVLPETARRLGASVDGLISSEMICDESRVVFVDDGSRDRTWALIENLASGSNRFAGIKLSRNVGHQNALLCGLLNTEGDALISMDADLQDDLGVIREMLLAYTDGADIVYGVRRIRRADTVFKRVTATSYYRLLQLLGVNIIFNHADFRLMSRQAINALHEFGEVNLFLRGIIPQLGSTPK
jgi:glycosyltransferase involved in cell wall biosynthesis